MSGMEIPRWPKGREVSPCELLFKRVLRGCALTQVATCVWVFVRTGACAHLCLRGGVQHARRHPRIVCDNTLLDGIIKVDSAVTRFRVPLRASAESAGRRRVPLLISGMFVLGGEVYQ